MEQPPPFVARRAMLEDLDQLRLLWAVEQLPELRLEKTFTDFQVVESADGRVVAALALQVDGKHGRLHSEAFEDFGHTTVLRPLLWDRIQNVARNRGLIRLWTQESAPFWREQGMESPPFEVLEKLPLSFDTGKPGWLTLKLKDEVLSSLSPEQEFALFQQAAREDTERLKQQARTMKLVATVVAVIFFLLVVVGGVLFLKYQEAERSGRLPSQQNRR
jgi:hypothetical protein